MDLRFRERSGRGTAISHSTASTNTTLFNAAQPDQCWQEWQSYWNASSSGRTQSTTFTTAIVQESYSDTWQTYQVTTTATEMNGNFPTRTYVTVITTSTYHITAYPTYTSTGVVTRKANATITPPPCALSSYVSQCQSAWEDWIHGETWNTPDCTQASITGSLCSSLQSNWLETEGVVGEVDGKVGMRVTTMTLSNTTETSSWWPSTSILAPGCSVGCQSCRVSGSNVQLLYWPPATTAYRNGTLHAVTERANATGIVTAVAHGTTLTSPTVYISFDRLYASDSCSVVGSTIYNTIVAITNSATLSSLYGWARYGGLQQTASFNFTDLYVTPVPQSIYASQPRCASSSNSINYSCLRFGTTGGPLCASALGGEFVCATSLPYQPVLAMPAEVRDLQPEWASCLGGLAGVYDALHAAVSAAAVTVPKESTAAKTTSQAEVVATTKASPSPTISGAAPATNMPSASAVPAPAQSSEDPIVASSTQQAVGQSQPAASDEADPEAASSNARDILTQAQSALGSQSSANLATASSPKDPSQISSLAAAVSTVTSSDDTQPPDGQASFSYDPATSASGEAEPTDAISPALSVVSNAQSNSQASSWENNNAGNTAVAVGSDVVVVNPTTTAVLEPGNTAIIGSQTFNVRTSGVVIDGYSASLLGSIAAPTAHVESPAAVWTVSSQGITAQKDPSGVVIQGAGSTATVAQGSEATFASHTISVEANGAVVHLDGSSMTLYTSAAVWTPSAEQVSAHLEQSNIILAGPEITTTIARGSIATFAGQTISADQTGPAIHVDGSSIPLTTTPQHFSYAPETSLVGLALPSTTLLPGSAAIISGTTYSLPPSNSATEIYINGHQAATLLPSDLITLPNGLVATPTTIQIQIQSLPSFLPSADPTLLPGSATVVAGTTYSLARSGNSANEIYINGHATSLTNLPFNTPAPPPQVITVSSLPALLVGSQTFIPGGPVITVSGTTYSANGTSVVVKGPETTFTRAVTAFDSKGAAEGETSTMSTTTRETSAGTTSTTTTGGVVPSETTTATRSGAGGLSPSPVVVTISLLSMLYAAYEIFVIFRVNI
ncbi:Hypothetical predicted protein [Lecanosticta acicola]|uniref:Uncharacterized protein n=1 Tax=Lecanosticta acicola TaxID=111012 RepID=A0AAI8YUZ7_9PEZI|nr:Hypothetical predicted protein [Lecanosticta acicola]